MPLIRTGMILDPAILADDMVDLRALTEAGAPG